MTRFGFAVAAGFLVVCGFGAASAQQDATDQVDEPPSKTIDFEEGDEVTGKVVGPDEDPVHVRTPPRLPSLVKVRDDLAAEMKESAESL